MAKQDDHLEMHLKHHQKIQSGLFSCHSSQSILPFSFLNPQLHPVYFKTSNLEYKK